MNAAAAARMGPWADVLEERGHEVVILTSREASESEDSRVWTSRFGVPSNQVSLSRRLFQEVRLGRDLGRELRKLAPSLDLAVITSPPFFLAMHCAKVAQNCSLGFHLDVRDRYPGVLFDLGLLRRNGLIGRILSGMERRAYAAASFISTVTLSLTKELTEVVDAGEVFHAPNGFDGVLFPEKLFERRKREQFTVVYHGRFSRLHDVETLRMLTLAVSEKDSEIRFLIVGPVPDEVRNRDWGSTSFSGEKPREEIPALLAECHLGVSLMKPSRATYVAMPAKIFEYLGAGLPVMACPKGELTDFVRKKEIGLTFEKADVANMAEEICSLKSNCSRMDQVVSNVRSVRKDLERRSAAMSLVEKLESL